MHGQERCGSGHAYAHHARPKHVREISKIKGLGSLIHYGSTQYAMDLPTIASALSPISVLLLSKLDISSLNLFTSTVDASHIIASEINDVSPNHLRMRLQEGFHQSIQLLSEISD